MISLYDYLVHKYSGNEDEIDIEFANIRQGLIALIIKGPIEKVIPQLVQVHKILHAWKDAEDINNGGCVDFADDLIELFPDGRSIDLEEVMPDVIEHHSFFQYNELYYDSETPCGVSDWKQLPFFKRA